jgi:CO/xanthine dehydrogenase Mo-binding subunit
MVASALGWSTPTSGHVGRGIAVGVLAAGAQPVSTAIARLEADGRVVVLVGTTEMGQGARTVMAQLTAEQLGLTVDHVRVRSTDTRFTPYDRSTGASRSTTVAGLAVQRAAQELRRRVLDIAADVWGVPVDLLHISDGVVRYETEQLSYPELLTRYFGMAGGELIAHGEVRPEAGRGSFASGPVFWEVGVAAAEVATLQGLGNALFEEILFDEGRLVNGTLLQYRVPTTLDLPDEMESLLVENADGPGPDGAKGCGEGALAAVVAAIATAVADAGVEVTVLPLTPERVWRSISRKG